MANFPFATIEPNIGVVPVPDERLEKLAEVIKEAEGMDQLPPLVPATVEFVDIAGLIAGASKGEGLGNKFLSHIREVAAICHVLRCFSDPEIVKQGVVDPVTDLETVETELKLADLETLEKQRDPGNTPDKEAKKRWEVILKLKGALRKGVPAREVNLSEEETKIAKQLSLLTAKPILIVLNVDEGQVADSQKLESDFAREAGVNESQVIAVCAKIEAEIAGLSENEQKEYLEALGIKHSALDRLIKKAFETLGLITFLTAGEKEVRAWTIKEGTPAVEAAGVIHSDFMKHFIKADVCDFDDFISLGGWKACREVGKVRSEGRDYLVKDGDVIEFRIGV